MSAESLFAPDFREEPYWWDAARPLDEEPESLPAKIDVAVIGAGLTGLNTALVLARAGRGVAVFDKGDLGQGASSRNAGYVGRSLKHSFGEIAKRFGLERAIAVYREMQRAFEAVGEVIESEQIACQFKICGRVIMARSASQYDDLARELELKRQHLGDDYAMISREALGTEIATDRFFGGALVPNMGSLHPGLYQRGLLDRARAQGAILLGQTPVERITPNGKSGGFMLATPRGAVQAREVFVATNGYSGAAFSWLRRRLIPFDAYMIATEPLPAERMSRLLPQDRTFIDHAHNIIFMRRSPDGARILFGGRTGSRMTSLKAKAAEIHTLAGSVVPGFAELKLSHAWTGRCAGTFDLYPHIGTHDGIHFAAGYCFAGVPMGTYLGRLAAQRILGRPARTLFAERRFPTVPFYSGNPWFVPAAMAIYDWRDRRDRRARP
ncbi:MAG TPA: FAD-binding oxidoreductase [Alphaproteobacteria bacterium]|nr:FAD-binding oxidoreductase [Alphaproteobacteria bacterium]